MLARAAEYIRHGLLLSNHVLASALHCYP
jgi:hypothetical protein